MTSWRPSSNPDPKDSWPVAQTDQKPTRHDPRIGKAIFDPHDPDEEFDDFDSEDEDRSDISSRAETEEWIDDDDRASDSIAPSIVSEPEHQRHRGLMQQPPRSTTSSPFI